MTRGRTSRIGFGVLAALFATGWVMAQSVEDRRKELLSAKVQAARSARQAEQLEMRADQEAGAAIQAQIRSAAVAARIQANEADIIEAEARLRLIQKMREHVRARLAERQRPAIRLIAALQTLAARPPALALVQPGTTRDLVHVRMLLAGLAPEIRKQTQDLRADLDQNRRLEADASRAVALLAQGQEKLKSSRVALVKLEAAHRVASTRFARGAMAEQDRAIAMGEKARDIVDLIDQLGVQSIRQAALERLPGPLMRPDRPGQADQAPLEQVALPIADRMGYRLPVTGTLVTGLGELSTSGARAKGLTLRTQPQAQVVAPRAGRIVFAGPFRGYNQIVIVDHGGGWTSLVTGLASLAVRVGDRVIDGSPLGQTGRGTPMVSLELRRSGNPVDITVFVS